MIGVLEPMVLMAVLMLALASGLGVERAWSLRSHGSKDEGIEQCYGELVLRTMFVLCWCALLLAIFAALRLWPRVSGAMCAAGLMTEPYAYALPAMYAAVLFAGTSMGAALPWKHARRLPMTQMFWWMVSALLAALALLLVLFFASREMVSGGTCCSTARVANRALAASDGGLRWPAFVCVVILCAFGMARPWLQHRWVLLAIAVSYVVYPYAFSQVTAPHILRDPLDTCVYCALEHSLWAALPLLGVPLAVFFTMRNSQHSESAKRAIWLEVSAHAVCLAALLAPVALYVARTGRLVFGYG